MRLAKGTRLLDPATSTYYKYGGRYVSFIRWTIDHKIIVRMSGSYHLIDPEAVGLTKPSKPTQVRMRF